MKTYTVVIGGVEHTMQLDDDDAKKYGDAATEAKSGGAQNKARSTKNKES